MDDLCAFFILEIALVLRRLQVLSVVDLVDVDLAELPQVSEECVAQLHTFFGPRQRLRVVLGLAEDGAQLEPKLALEPVAPVSTGQTVVVHELGALEHFEALFQVGRALFEHAELLKTHRHVVARDELDVLVASARLQIHDLQHTLRLLEKHQRLLVRLSLDEVVRRVRQLSQDDGDLSLVHFDFLVVEGVEAVFFGGLLVASVGGALGPLLTCEAALDVECGERAATGRGLCLFGRG